ncbi:hypothetical protein IFM89_002031 [Coptis chinensis]|uniref:HD domain-containing protein n=1 Tax=Coptis chinensis TaxID=261450 RepID=A0A835GV74_9MAGN|nr:hypothetical protein IFM89_002031 [Coptis chinensis]
MGAVHSQFEHSLGVYFLSGEAVEKLQKYHGLELGVEPLDLQTVKFAGVLHDIGHGPFSHLYESEFLPRVLNRCTWSHENMSVDMIDYIVDEHHIDVDSGILKIAKEMILASSEIEVPQRTGETSFLYDIVANGRNGIDVDKRFEHLTISLKDLTSSSHLEDQRPSSRKLKSFVIAIFWQVILLMTLLVFGERDYSMFVSSRSSCHQTQNKLTMERLGNTTNHDHMKWPFNHHNHFQARGASKHSCVCDDIHALDPRWKLDFSGGVAYKSHSITKFDMLLMEKPHHLENSSLMHGAATLVDGFRINFSPIFNPGPLLGTDKFSTLN